MKPKQSLHPKNRHQGRYDFDALEKACPELKKFVRLNPYDPSLGKTIDFSQADAVKCLNKALLRLYYGISFWDLPKGALCPPIPGRVDYIHYLADLLSKNLSSLKGSKVNVLDVGSGANCIYPLLGVKAYAWHFVASDIDESSLENAQKIVNENALDESIELRKQVNAKNVFKGIIQEKDSFALTMCNPPFHSSKEEAASGSLRKWKNLGKDKGKNPKQTLNFGGVSNELWCEGGEKSFVSIMIEESKIFQKQVLWFSTLVSKGENLHHFKELLKKAKATKVEIIEMGQGQKVSRILAWKF